MIFLTAFLKAVSQLTLTSLSPTKQITRRDGTHRLNSFIQLCNVDFGTKTMWGPGMFL